jgi:hypothetical protein
MRRAAMICAAGFAFTASPVAVGTNSQPHLGTVTPQSGHLLLSLTVGDLTPRDVQIASSASKLPSGAFLSSRVMLRERMGISSQPGVIHWRTRAPLPAGTYYVHVSALLSGGVTSCVHATNCLLRWSNVVSVRVPK